MYMYVLELEKAVEKKNPENPWVLYFVNININRNCHCNYIMYYTHAKNPFPPH